MSTASLARCPSCRAIVNAHWETCLACRGPLEGDSQDNTSSSPPVPSWLQQWQRLARVSGMISEEDPRYDPILVALGACQNAYKAGDQLRFTKEADHVMRLAAFVPGSVIRWRGHDKKAHGPSTITEVFYEDGRLWACVKWAGQLYWVSDSIIESLTVDGRSLQNRAATEDQA